LRTCLFIDNRIAGKQTQRQTIGHGTKIPEGLIIWVQPQMWRQHRHQTVIQIQPALSEMRIDATADGTHGSAAQLVGMLLEYAVRNIVHVSMVPINASGSSCSKQHW